MAMYQNQKVEKYHSDIIKQFEDIGAKVKVRKPNPNRLFNRLGGRQFNNNSDNNNNSTFVVDVIETKNDEYFDITVSDDVKVNVVNKDKNDRHILLHAEIPTDDKFTPEIVKALCGHDERHWFSSQVNIDVATIREAKDSLKPNGIIELQKQKRVKRKDWNKRKNNGYIRQGEWFFIPSDLYPNPNLIHKNEPIIMSGRRGGKPHMAEFAYRTGGVQVNVLNISDEVLSNYNLSPRDGDRLRAGVTNTGKKDFIARCKDLKDFSWMVMTRDAILYVKGKIRHPDHATLKLRGWYRVIVNKEIRDKNVVFLD